MSTGKLIRPHLLPFALVIPLLLSIRISAILPATPRSDVSNPASLAANRLTILPARNAGIIQLMKSLKIQLDSTRFYDPSYTALAYPGGDIPLSTGVCADVIVRALRNAGVDLQVEIFSDMKAHFLAYPQLWGARGPDKNIDHRRVPNQMRFFERRKKSVDITSDPGTYRPGDIVAWLLPNNLYHIGMVADTHSPPTGNPMVVHNIGRGAEIGDCLFRWKIIGHYRWFE